MYNFVLVSQGSAQMQQLLIFAVIGVLFYMMLIRPQQKQRRAHQAMLGALKTGDKVTTAGGIMGIITNVKETSVIVKIADNVKIEISRGHISKVIPKTTETNENNNSAQ